MRIGAIKIGLCILCLAACRQAPKATKDESQERFETSYSAFRRLAGADPRKRPDWEHDADSLYHLVKLFGYHASVVREELFDKDHHVLDPQLTDKELAQKLLTHTPLGDSLRGEFSDVVEYCYRIPETRDESGTLDIFLGNLRGRVPVMSWNSTFFRSTTWDAWAQLGYFERSAYEAGAVIFEAMSRRF
jgi:hypothetical protein